MVFCRNIKSDKKFVGISLRNPERGVNADYRTLMQKDLNLRGLSPFALTIFMLYCKEIMYIFSLRECSP